MNDLTWAEKDLICKSKGLHIKYGEQIKDYPDFYQTKMRKLQEQVDEEYRKYDELLTICKDRITKADLEKLSDIMFLNQKIARLRKKQDAVRYELEGRELGIFKRTPHGTIYYIDLNAGNDGNTGLTIAQAWRTIEQYTTTTVRTPGDIAYIRANTQEIFAADIQFDEDGSKDKYIYIIGCDATTDPWGDGSNVKSIVNANGNNVSLNLNGDEYWHIENLDLINSGDQIIDMGSYSFVSFKKLDIHDNGNHGLISTLDTYSIIDDCNFYNNTTSNIFYNYFGIIKIKDSIFNGGAGGTQYGLNFPHGGIAEIIDSSFGQTTAHTVLDIYNVRSGIISIKNVLYNSVNNTWHFGNFFEEDRQQTYRVGYIYSYTGTITKDTAIKTGSALFSLKFQPNTNCGLNNPLVSEENYLTRGSYIIQGVANTALTATIKIRSLGVWAAYPTADELYIEASYYDNASDCGRSTIQSTTVLNDETTWRDFSITMTPLRSGPIYINAYLKKFEAGKGCYVNGEVVTS